MIARANTTLNCLCCRTNCFGLFYKDLFHSNAQLEEMLSEGFDGRRFGVKAHDGVNLDCMFFPFNEEKVVT